MESELEGFHFDLLREFEDGERRKMSRKMIAISDGKSKCKEGLKELENREWIRRTGYGEFQITSTGKKVVSGKVACEDCGRHFASELEARKEATLFCSHDNISLKMENF